MADAMVWGCAVPGRRKRERRGGGRGGRGGAEEGRRRSLQLLPDRRGGRWGGVGGGAGGGGGEHLGPRGEVIRGEIEGSRRAGRAGRPRPIGTTAGRDFPWPGTENVLREPAQAFVEAEISHAKLQLYARRTDRSLRTMRTRDGGAREGGGRVEGSLGGKGVVRNRVSQELKSGKVKRIKSSIED